MFRKSCLLILFLLICSNVTAKTKLDGMSIYLLGTMNISPEGVVSNLRLASSKNSSVDNVLKQQISTWKFKPVVVDGKIIEAKAEIDVLLDVALDENGKETSMRIASVRFKLLNGPKYESTSNLSYGFHNVVYPIDVFKIAEANVLVALSTNPDGSVKHLGIKNLRIFPADRMGLSDSQLNMVTEQLAESVESQRAFIGVKSNKADQEKISCEKACVIMIFYNFPKLNRFRKWRGYQNTQLPELDWLKQHEVDQQERDQSSDPYIKLVDPKQMHLNL